MTDKSVWSIIEEASNTTIALPMGFELGVLPGLNVRLGATHTIQKTKNTATSETVSAPQTTTVSETAGGTATTYGSANDLRKAVTTAEKTTQSTSFYYGAGYRWSENVMIDILGCFNLTNVSAWEVGLTLLFN